MAVEFQVKMPQPKLLCLDDKIKKNDHIFFLFKNTEIERCFSPIKLILSKYLSIGLSSQARYELKKNFYG